jgi:hypothetical protein
MERAVHVGYEQLYILLKRRRRDQAPIDVLANRTHGRISATTVSKRGPTSKLEVRNNNVCLLPSRVI